MVRSIDPKREPIRGAQRYSDTAAMFGTRVAETISARGQGQPHQQAGHMAASDPIKTLRRLLQARGRPHMTFWPFVATPVEMFRSPRGHAATRGKDGGGAKLGSMSARLSRPSHSRSRPRSCRAIHDAATFERDK